ncbi:hypothetical protein [Occallatibacter riparius]|uniref:Uncharacterized protein n=1 Tax=Occallatibacter riparius TaxID=1002689 RepID=A0A9J7BZA2_9BACT|nr:hypothetical protein [Occallatibacter riparius]UWZ86958.1 hypothetical protein MOP44_13645 [Occallatibacter riparius]
MTIARTIRLAALIAALSVGLAALGCELFYLHWLRSVVAAGNRQLLETEPGAFDRDLRTALPLSTPKGAVEETLRNRHIPYQYYPAWRLIQAIVPDLKGSNPLRETSLRMNFQFDAQGSLSKIESSVINSGL